MKYLSFLLFIVIVVAGCKKEKEQLHEPVMNISTDESLLGVYSKVSVLTPDGNILLCSEDSQNGIVHLAKITPACNVIWSRVFTMPSSMVNSIVINEFGNIFIVGAHFFNSQQDGYVFKLAENGDSLWYKEYGGNQPEYFNCAMAQPGGGVFVAGKSASFSPDGASWPYLLNINAAGDTLWTKSYSIGNNDLLINAIAKTENGNYAIAGINTSVSYTAMVFMLDAEGNLLWQTTDFPASSAFKKIIALPNNQLAANGYVIVNNIKRALVVKLDNAGAKLWQKTLPNNTSAEEGVGITNSTNGSIMNVFSSVSTVNSGKAGKVNFLTSDGDETWSTYFGSNVKAVPSDILLKQDGTYIIIGLATNNSGATSLFTLQVDANGNFIP